MAKEKITVCTKGYEAVHGRAPKGYGAWVFTIGDGLFNFTGIYSEGKKAAIEQARKNHASKIIVGA